MLIASKSRRCLPLIPAVGRLTLLKVQKPDPHTLHPHVKLVQTISLWHLRLNAKAPPDLAPPKLACASHKDKVSQVLPENVVEEQPHFVWTSNLGTTCALTFTWKARIFPRQPLMSGRLFNLQLLILPSPSEEQLRHLHLVFIVIVFVKAAFVSIPNPYGAARPQLQAKQLHLGAIRKLSNARTQGPLQVKTLEDKAVPQSLSKLHYAGARMVNFKWKGESLTGCITIFNPKLTLAFLSSQQPLNAHFLPLVFPLLPKPLAQEAQWLQPILQIFKAVFKQISLLTPNEIPKLHRSTFLALPSKKPPPKLPYFYGVRTPPLGLPN